MKSTNALDLTMVRNASKNRFEMPAAINLRNVDLNLLVVLEALLEERSVARAAERLHLSQSATSHALARLRAILGDEILVRTAHGMTPTARAQEMKDVLEQILEDLRELLTVQDFDPATAKGEFVLAVETYETIFLVSEFIEKVAAAVPNIRMEYRSGSPAEIYAGLDQNRIDLAIGAFTNAPERFMKCHLMSDTHVCLMRPGHSLNTDIMSIEDYLKARHLFISMSASRTDAVDDALVQLGRQRTIAMSVPNGLAAIIAISQTDMVASVTAGAAHVMATMAGLAVRPLPFATPRVSFSLLWNRRVQQQPANMWLRRRMTAIGESVGKQAGFPASIK